MKRAVTLVIASVALSVAPVVAAAQSRPDRGNTQGPAFDLGLLIAIDAVLAGTAAYLILNDLLGDEDRPRSA